MTVSVRLVRGVLARQSSLSDHGNGSDRAGRAHSDERSPVLYSINGQEKICQEARAFFLKIYVFTKKQR